MLMRIMIFPRFRFIRNMLLLVKQDGRWDLDLYFG
jgi:hypothetical protein